MKSLIKKLARRFGIDVGYYVPMKENPFDVLDLVLDRLVRTEGGFNFLQIGAFDGQAGDPIHAAVVRYNPHGILVEPNPAAFQKLTQNYAGRSGLIFENCAIAWEDGLATLYRFKPDSSLPEWTQQLTSFSRERVLAGGKALNRAASFVEPFSVPAISLKTLTNKHGIKSLGLLQIDTEGFDFEIIKMAFAAGLYPKVLNYEHFHLSLPDQHACQLLLAANAYRYITIGMDTLAVRDGQSGG